MTPVISFTTPLIFCRRCRRELRFLFCPHCALAGLDDAAILANARDIRLISKRPVAKVRAKSDCVLCAQAIPVGQAARLLTEAVVAHLECVRRLQERLAATAPQESQLAEGDLPFGDGAIEVD
jgi:hypothetical protein